MKTLYLFILLTLLPNIPVSASILENVTGTVRYQLLYTTGNPSKPASTTFAYNINQIDGGFRISASGSVPVNCSACSPKSRATSNKLTILTVEGDAPGMWIKDGSNYQYFPPKSTPEFTWSIASGVKSWSKSFDIIIDDATSTYWNGYISGYSGTGVLKYSKVRRYQYILDKSSLNLSAEVGKFATGEVNLMRIGDATEAELTIKNGSSSMQVSIDGVRWYSPVDRIKIDPEMVNVPIKFRIRGTSSGTSTMFITIVITPI